MKFTRIAARPDVCTGKPCIRDLRFPVSRLLGLLAAGQTPGQILQAYPYLEAADIEESLKYAAGGANTLRHPGRAEVASRLTTPRTPLPK